MLFFAMLSSSVSGFFCPVVSSMYPCWYFCFSSICSSIGCVFRRVAVFYEILLGFGRKCHVYVVSRILFSAIFHFSGVSCSFRRFCHVSPQFSSVLFMCSCFVRCIRCPCPVCLSIFVVANLVIHVVVVGCLYLLYMICLVSLISPRCQFGPRICLMHCM